MKGENDMASNVAIIYEETGANPGTDRIERERGGKRTTFVAVPDEDGASRVAVELVDGGVRAIELCGGMGPVPAAKVIEAVGDRVPVGLVNFGVESVTGAAAYKAKSERGGPTVAAFIFLAEGANPATDRVVTEPGSVRTFFVPVPDEGTAARVAAELVEDEGVELIELYRGIGTVGAARVIEAVRGRIPVGAVGYGEESVRGLSALLPQTS